MKYSSLLFSITLFLSLSAHCQTMENTFTYQSANKEVLPYTINDTWQSFCFGNSSVIDTPLAGQDFYGQDAQQIKRAVSFNDNGDGTVTDLNTGLVWVKARREKVTWEKAVAGAKTCNLGGYNDWRMPTIKELYSLINFNGYSGFSAAESTPYLDTKYFEIAFGNVEKGERLIDAQDWSANEYVSTTMHEDATVFGVNFIDGRIKGYPKFRPRTKVPNSLYVRYVRGNPLYGQNKFVDNGNKTISDNSTGLMWAKTDSGSGMNWKDALAWIQQKNEEKYLGYSDWRLPNAKELQSIVDYSRSPATTNSPAIDPSFNCTKINNESGQEDYPFYWTSTTHLEGRIRGEAAVYICFGRGLGFMRGPMGGNPVLLDVHGAGCQRSDPKSGNASNYPFGRGPQGDVIRILNFVRPVRTLK